VVDPTSSQNITVSHGRSIADATNIAAQCYDRSEQLALMLDRARPEVLQVQAISQYRGVDRVALKRGLVLLLPTAATPVRDLHDASFGLVSVLYVTRGS
jgi:hypothetical protein